MHSFHSAHNSLNWKLVVRGEVAHWPPFERGFPIVAMSPYGLAGPAGMPAEVVQVLHQAFKAAMNDPAFVAELARQLQGRGPALALPLTWIEQRLSESGLTIAQLVQAENQQQAANQAEQAPGQYPGGMVFDGGAHGGRRGVRLGWRAAGHSGTDLLGTIAP